MTRSTYFRKLRNDIFKLIIKINIKLINYKNFNIYENL